MLSCYDRIVITGTLPGACYARGMTSYLYAQQIKVFDHAKVLADPLRNKIRENAQLIANVHGIAIEHVIVNFAATANIPASHKAF